MSYIRLCSRQTCDGHTVGRAGYVVEADSVAEFDRRGIAAVFAADTAMDIVASSVAKLNCHFHQFTNTGGIETSKRIGFVNLCTVVGG